MCVRCMTKSCMCRTGMPCALYIIIHTSEHREQHGEIMPKHGMMCETCDGNHQAWCHARDGMWVWVCQMGVARGVPINYMGTSDSDKQVHMVMRRSGKELGRGNDMGGGPHHDKEWPRNDTQHVLNVTLKRPGDDPEVGRTVGRTVRRTVRPHRAHALCVAPCGASCVSFLITFCWTR